MKGKAKSRIALALAAALALWAVGALSSMAWLAERATNLDPDPNGVEAIGSEDEAAGENDGPGGVDWGYWQSVNPDIIGWVAVPGTGIDYPIVQAHEGDPDHYLRYDVYGGWNYHGVPYLHWKCADDGLLGAGNALVFGHTSTTARCSPRWRGSRTPVTRRDIPRSSCRPPRATPG